LEKFLLRDRLLSLGGVLVVVWAKDKVVQVEHLTAEAAEAGGPPLGRHDLVINKDVHVLGRAPTMAVALVSASAGQRKDACTVLACRAADPGSLGDGISRGRWG
jgi:hypothetical protein